MTKQNLLENLAATAELMGQSVSQAALVMMAIDLQSHPIEIVIEACARLRRESKAKFSLAGIIEKIESLQPDGRPGAEEAWAMIPQDEQASCVMTAEMAEAWGIAKSLLDDGDKVGARMTFREVYIRLVDASKRGGLPVKWFPSFGRDPAMRVTVLQEAVRLGRIGATHAERILPPDILNLPDHATRLAIENQTPVSDEQARVNIAKIKLMIGNSRIGGAT